MIKIFKTKDVFERLFLVIWGMYSLFYFLLQTTEFKYMYEVTSIYLSISYMVGIALLILFFLNKRRLKTVQFIAYAIIALLLFFSVYKLKDPYLIVAYGFIINARRIKFNNFISFDFKLKLFLLLFVVALCLIGVIPNYQSVINGAYKQAFGFTHPNQFSAFAFSILIEWIVIRYKRINIRDYVILMITTGILWSLSASRTSVFTFVFIILLTIISKSTDRPFKNKYVINAIAILPTLLCLISFWLVNSYRNGNLFAIGFDQITTGRIRIGALNYTMYGISLFGQIFNTYSTRTFETRSFDAIRSVDMAYIYIPIRYGIIILLLLLIGYFFYIRYIAKIYNTPLLIACIFFCLLGFGEVFFFLVQYNFTLVFIIAYIGRNNLPFGVISNTHTREIKSNSLSKIRIRS